MARSILALVIVALMLAAGLSEGASDSREVVQASEILAKIECGEPVEYDGVIIEGDLDLKVLDLPTEHTERSEFQIEVCGLAEDAKLVNSLIKITNCTINGDVNFSDTIFLKKVIFGVSTKEEGFINLAPIYNEQGIVVEPNFDETSHSQTQLNGTVNFKGVRFGGGVNFIDSLFNGNADFSWARFDSSADFTGVRFDEDADFSFAQFNWTPDLIDAQFNGYADFSWAWFYSGAEFTEVQFNGNTEFIGTRFDGDADFSRAVFDSNADFTCAVFSENHEFTGALFNDDADFSWAVFDSGAKFTEVQFNCAVFFGASFYGDAHFEWAQFSGDADFSESQFSGDANFSESQFSDNRNSKIDFGMASFDRNASFVDTQFSQYADFRETCFNNSLNLTHARFDRLELRWNSIENHLNCDDTAYMALIKNYENLAWFEDADECLYAYRNWRRENSEFGLSKILDYVFFLSCGYGVKWLRPIGLGLLIIIACAIYYRLTNAIRRHEKEGNNQDANIWDALYFSMMTFTTVGYGDWYPLDKHRKIAMIEGLMGWLTLSLFLVTLANVVIR